MMDAHGIDITASNARHASRKLRHHRGGVLAMLMAMLGVFACNAHAQAAGVAASTDSVLVDAPMLDAQFWIARATAPERTLLLSRGAIDRQNAQLLRDDPSMHDLRALPTTMRRADVIKRINARSSRPTRTLYGEDGLRIDASEIDKLIAAMDLESIVDPVKLEYGVVTQRADLRTFPAAPRAFSAPGDIDIDRFQESVLPIGTPVAVLHVSGNDEWLFVIAPDYAAWIWRDAVAMSSREQALAFAQPAHVLTITGHQAQTVYAPMQAETSRRTLEMGSRLPWLHDWPQTQPIHGQLRNGGWVISMPTRDAQGRLQVMPALLPRNADVTAEPLAYTPANLLRQAFKLLGQRYGWGGDYDGHDCSSFVQAVHAAFGIRMPRNTGDQARSPAFRRLPVDAKMTPQARAKLLAMLDVGDLIYIPGHVMLMIGRVDGAPYVIHATPMVRYRDAATHAIVSLPVNAVTVTPLLPLVTESGTSYTDLIKHVVRMRETPP